VRQDPQGSVSTAAVYQPLPWAAMHSGSAGGCLRLSGWRLCSCVSVSASVSSPLQPCWCAALKPACRLARPAYLLMTRLCSALSLHTCAAAGASESRRTHAVTTDAEVAAPNSEGDAEVVRCLAVPPKSSICVFFWEVVKRLSVVKRTRYCRLHTVVDNQ